MAAWLHFPNASEQRRPSGRRGADLERAQAVAHVGSWISTPAEPRTLVWSSETHRIFGLAPGEFDGGMEAFFSIYFLDPADRVAVRSAAEAAWRGAALLPGSPHRAAGWSRGVGSPAGGRGTGRGRAARPDGGGGAGHHRAQGGGGQAGGPSPPTAALAGRHLGARNARAPAQAGGQRGAGRTGQPPRYPSALPDRGESGDPPPPAAGVPDPGREGPVA